MADVSETEQLENSDPLSEMNKKQRLAAFLVMVGPETASDILGALEDREVEEISSEMAQIEFIDIPMQKALMEEFSEITMNAVTSLTAGPKYTKEVLERSIGRYKANEMLRRVAPDRVANVNNSILAEIQPKQLVSLLRREQTQTWALVLSLLDAERCAEVLAQLNPDFRIDIVERIATMEPISADVVEQVLQLIKKFTATRSQGDTTPAGGKKLLAEVLNSLDETTSKQVLTSLEERNPELSRSVKKLLFTFEDLVDLDKSQMARLMREVDFKVLAIALKTAGDRLKGSVMGALSKRAAEMVEEEIRFMPPVRLSDVEDAQEKIIEIVRNLEASGEIVLSKKGDKGDALI